MKVAENRKTVPRVVWFTPTFNAKIEKAADEQGMNVPDFIRATLAFSLLKTPQLEDTH